MKSAGIFLYKPWRPQCCFPFEIILNVLISLGHAASLQYLFYGISAIINILIFKMYMVGPRIERVNTNTDDSLHATFPLCNLRHVMQVRIISICIDL